MTAARSLIAFETSTAVCSVALLWREADGRWQVYSEAQQTTADHAQHVLPMAERLLARAGLRRESLGAVAFGQGPGGFTGLRVGCAAAQGIAYALGVPVLAVPSSLALAAASDAEAALDMRSAATQPQDLRVVAQDARMEESYLSAYQPPVEAGGAWDTVMAPTLVAQADLPSLVSALQPVQAGGWQWAGDIAVPAEAAACGLQPASHSLPSAVSVAWLAWHAWQRGEGQSPETVAPLYVRDKVAYTTAERAAGLGGNPRARRTNWQVEPMRESHLDEVATIESDVQAFPWSRRSFADGLAAGYAAWVVRDQGRVVGFCMVLFAPDVAHLLVIGVSPQRQRAGIGAALLAQVVREAQARGLPSVLLEVRVSNQQAQAFYRLHGFQDIAVRKAYYPAPQGQREDAQIWQRALAAESAS